MNEIVQSSVRLTEEQGRLVRDNIGLVAVHLRRHVANLTTPRRDREWEDLFQEGCLGLIRAAVKYREQDGIPFAAFALPRIHNAVSRALQSKFSTVYVPPLRAPSSGKAGDTSTTQPARPIVCSLSEELERGLTDRVRHHPFEPPGETIGQRIREKYERAVHRAGRSLSAKTSTRGDRGELVEILERERFLVPQEEERTALRQIARDTKSSYARVAQCDKQFGDNVRQLLERDPEFHVLRRQARMHPFGVDIEIDDDLERDLRLASTDEWIKRFRNADSTRQVRMLHSVLEVSHMDMEGMVRDCLERVPRAKQQQLLEDS